MDDERYQSEFIVTARKWRPLKFHDIVGQQHVATTLKNAVLTGRIPNAYLFSGPRGVGKTTSARILARALNCDNPQDAEPCNVCTTCTSVLDGRSLDVIEIDGASNNSVDDIRKLRENAKYPPSAGKYKMYIIDEVHMLSTSAFNALLKTLEEPPPHLLFVFATTEPHKVPATILSRCQRFEFRRMEIDSIVNHLKYIAGKENISIDEDSLFSIAKKADGSMRDSQSFFDQVVAFCGTTIRYSEMSEALHLIDRDFFFRISRAIVEKDIETIFNISRDVIRKGYDLQECLTGLLEHFRNLLSVKVTGNPSLIESSATYLERYQTDADAFTHADLLRLMNIANTAEQSLRFALQPSVKFELALLQMASLDRAVEIAELMNEIRTLKSGAGNQQVATSQQYSPVQQTSAQHSHATQQQVVQPVRQIYNSPTNQSNEQTINAPQVSQNNLQPTVFNSPTVNSPAPSAQRTTLGVDKATLAQNWNSFCDKFANVSEGLQLLNETDQVQAEFLNGEIILHTYGAFSSQNLTMRRRLLVDRLNDFYGSNISVKIVLEEKPVESLNLMTTPKAVFTVNQENNDIRQNPVNDQNTINNNLNSSISSIDKPENNLQADFHDKSVIEEKIEVISGNQPRTIETKIIEQPAAIISNEALPVTISTDSSNAASNLPDNLHPLERVIIERFNAVEKNL